MSEIKISSILDLIKNKNAVGFELLYQYHYKLLFSTAFAVSKNEQDSQDVVQNVFYKLSKLPPGKFPQKGEVSWLYRVVKNEATNFSKNRMQYSDLEDVDLPIMDKDISELFDMDSYYSLIGGLNEQQKEVVTLKVLGQLSHKEIARMLDKPIGTIQWIYNTSIKQLRISLAAMASFAFILLLGGAARLASIYSLLQTPPIMDSPMPNDPGISHSPGMSAPPSVENIEFLPYLLNDSAFVALLIATVTVIAGIILFLKFSYKLPTKSNK